MKTILKTTTLFYVLFGTFAQAHVGLEPNQASQGSYTRFALKVPHGCGSLATDTVSIDVPEGIQGAKPMPKAGWTLNTETSALKQPYDAHGQKMTEDVSRLTWSNGHLPNNYYDEFVFQAKMATHTGKVYFTVNQSCGSEKLTWSSQSHDDKYPAAVLEVIEAPNSAGHHH